jgi:hypothetical protein
VGQSLLPSRIADRSVCATYFYNRSPAQLEPEQVQAFLLHLTEAEHLAWSTVNQALAAFRFFYEKVLYRPHVDLRVPARRNADSSASSREKAARVAILSHSFPARCRCPNARRNHENEPPPS